MVNVLARQAAQVTRELRQHKQELPYEVDKSVALGFSQSRRWCEGRTQLWTQTARHEPKSNGTKPRRNPLPRWDGSRGGEFQDRCPRSASRGGSGPGGSAASHTEACSGTGCSAVVDHNLF